MKLDKLSPAEYANIPFERMILCGFVGHAKQTRHVSCVTLATVNPTTKDMMSHSIMHKLEGVAIAVIQMVRYPDCSLSLARLEFWFAGHLTRFRFHFPQLGILLDFARTMDPMSRLVTQKLVLSYLTV